MTEGGLILLMAAFLVLGEEENNANFPQLFS